MTKYHPIGMKVTPNKIVNLSNREVELIKMMRKVEGQDYYPLIKRMWDNYMTEMEVLKIDTDFISENRKTATSSHKTNNK